MWGFVLCWLCGVLGGRHFTVKNADEFHYILTTKGFFERPEIFTNAFLIMFDKTKCPLLDNASLPVNDLFAEVLEICSKSSINIDLLEYDYGEDLGLATHLAIPTDPAAPHKPNCTQVVFVRKHWNLIARLFEPQYYNGSIQEWWEFEGRGHVTWNRPTQASLYTVDANGIEVLEGEDEIEDSAYKLGTHFRVRLPNKDRTIVNDVHLDSVHQLISTPSPKEALRIFSKKHFEESILGFDFWYALHPTPIATFVIVHDATSRTAAKQVRSILKEFMGSGMFVRFAYYDESGTTESDQGELLRYLNITRTTTLNETMIQAYQGRLIGPNLVSILFLPWGTPSVDKGVWLTPSLSTISSLLAPVTVASASEQAASMEAYIKAVKAVRRAEDAAAAAVEAAAVAAKEAASEEEKAAAAIAKETAKMHAHWADNFTAQAAAIESTRATAITTAIATAGEPAAAAEAASTSLSCTDNTGADGIVCEGKLLVPKELKKDVYSPVTPLMDDVYNFALAQINVTVSVENKDEHGMTLRVEILPPLGLEHLQQPLINVLVPVSHGLTHRVLLGSHLKAVWLLPDGLEKVGAQLVVHRERVVLFASSAFSVLDIGDEWLEWQLFSRHHVGRLPFRAEQYNRLTRLYHKIDRYHPVGFFKVRTSSYIEERLQTWDRSTMEAQTYGETFMPKLETDDKKVPYIAREAYRHWHHLNSHQTPSLIHAYTPDRNSDNQMEAEIAGATMPLCQQLLGNVEDLVCTDVTMHVYTNGSRVAAHIDAPSYHVCGIIMNIASEELAEPWYLEVVAHDGVEHSIEVLPGETVVYEASTVIHSRKKHLNGKRVANAFTHFMPRKWNSNTFLDFAEGEVERY